MSAALAAHKAALGRESQAMFLKHARNFRASREKLMQDARVAKPADRAFYVHWARRCNKSVVHFSRHARLAIVP